MEVFLFLQLVTLEKNKGIEYIKEHKDRFLPLYNYFKGNRKCLAKLDRLLS